MKAKTPLQHSYPSLSILIPTYNDNCVDLVKSLHAQAKALEGLEYEIIVADDGSSDIDSVEHNRVISMLPNCRFIERGENVGRASIRNFLAREARYKLLLFADSHMEVILPDYIERYLGKSASQLVYGGYTIDASLNEKSSLRYVYELSCIASQDYRERQRRPYANFHTSNFMIHRDVMLRYPLDERFRRYGYEDVLFGKTLKSAGVKILHIDNPLGFNRFESNERFLEKTLEGLDTLYDFRDELQGYSRLLDLSSKLRRLHMSGAVRFIYRLARGAVRRNLTGRHPSVMLFKIFRIGEYEERAD